MLLGLMERDSQSFPILTITYPIPAAKSDVALITTCKFTKSHAEASRLSVNANASARNL